MLRGQVNLAQRKVNLAPRHGDASSANTLIVVHCPAPLQLAPLRTAWSLG